MKSGSISVRLVALGVASFLATGAAARSGASAPAALLDVARGLVERAHFCALITIGPDGRAESRIVDPFAPEADWTVWIATKPVTRKVDQIRRDSRVTLAYWDATERGYVTLLGDAALVDDPAEKAKRWKPEWQAFYADENRGEDYLLIRVTPRRLEALSPAEGLLGDPETWRPAQYEFPAPPAAN